MRGWKGRLGRVCLAGLLLCLGAVYASARHSEATAGYFYDLQAPAGEGVHPLSPPGPIAVHDRRHILSVESAFHVPILEYHDIADTPNDKWAVGEPQFQREMDFLVEHHFHSISMDQLFGTMYRAARLQPRSVVITFDDGYESTYTRAFPVLKARHMHATVFMISGLVDHPGYLTGAELREMADSGLVQIESHTVHHKNLTNLSDRQTEFELAQSKASLTEIVHQPVRYFCYPYGGYRWQTLRDVEKAGYLLATTTKDGYASAADGAFRLRRLAVYGGISTQAFTDLLAPSLK